MMKNAKFLFLLSAFSLTLFACGGGTKTEEAKTGEQVNASTASAEAAKYVVDQAASLINWKGSKPGGEHLGSLKLSEGTLSVKDGNIESGKFTLDFNSISVEDIKDAEKKAYLESHLKGSGDPKGVDDFFNVAKYPTGTFEIASVTPISGDSLMTHTIVGNLTIKDKTNSVEFKAKVSNNGNNLTAESQEFSIDRTKWNINYQSKTVFNNLKDKFIDDAITLKIKLSANK